MKISRLSLRNFRTYPTRDFAFDPDLTVIAGPNGAGKTNVLEAVYLLATGKSWRGETTEEMIQFGEEVGHISIKYQVSSIKYESSRIDPSQISRPFELSVTLTRGTVQGQRVAKVKYKVDGVSKRKADLVGRLKVVLFEPQSLMIVIGDPSYRRGFLDDVLSQTDAEYRNDLHVYARALKVRNRLLDAIREGKAQREQLDYWERTMVKHGEKMQEARAQLLDWINQNLATKGQTLQGLTFLELEYDSSPISAERLEQYREREIAAGFSLVGPQRDDFKLQVTSDKLQARELNSFGSRGEQRMAVLRLKLAEAQWIEEKTGESPVLLLDDIYSELDDAHDQMIQELVRGRQTIITVTEMPSGFHASSNIVRL